MYEILGLKHVFSTFQETVWSHLKRINISLQISNQLARGHKTIGSHLKVTVDLRGVFWGKQYSALCINGKYINLYIIGELI